MKVKQLLDILKSADPDSDIAMRVYFEEDFNTMPGYKILEIGEILIEVENSKILLQESD